MVPRERAARGFLSHQIVVAVVVGLGDGASVDEAVAADADRLVVFVEIGLRFLQKATRASLARLAFEGYLGRITTGALVDYNTSTKAFLLDANFGATGTALTSNLQAWQTNVDVFDFDDLNPLTTTDVVMANGEDLKNALESFNQGKLITSADGTLVGWSTDGGVTVNYINDNDLDNFWLTLSAATSWV